MEIQSCFQGLTSAPPPPVTVGSFDQNGGFGEHPQLDDEFHYMTDQRHIKHMAQVRGLLHVKTEYELISILLAHHLKKSHNHGVSCINGVPGSSPSSENTRVCVGVCIFR